MSDPGSTEEGTTAGDGAGTLDRAAAGPPLSWAESDEAAATGTDESADPEVVAEEPIRSIYRVPDDEERIGD